MLSVFLSDQIFLCPERAPACFNARGWILTNVLTYCFYCSLTGRYTPKPSMSSAARIDGVFDRRPPRCKDMIRDAEDNGQGSFVAKRGKSANIVLI